MPAAVSTPYAEDILCVLRRRGVPANQLEDALQDVYLIALRQWPDGTQPIIHLLLQGFSIREISKALGIPLGTAFSRIRKIHLDAKRTLHRKAA